LFNEEGEKMKEKNFQQEFKTKNKIEGVFELKLCKGTSIPFSNIADHQVVALQNANSDVGLYHKLTDQPVSIHQKQEDKNMRFTRPAPFDCFFVKNYPAYVVIMFYTPRIRKNVFYIRINDFISMKLNTGRKSFTEEIAGRYACFQESYLKKGSINV